MRGNYLRPPLSEKYRRYLPVAIVLVVFLLIEVILFRVHSFPLARGETDGIGYMARAAGPLFQADPFHGPGYSLAIRVVQSTGLAPFASAKSVSLASAVVFLLATWLILKSLGSQQEALLAVLFIAFSPMTLVRGVTILSDMMAASLFLSTLALLVVPKEVRIQHFILAGVLAGLAYLTRYIYVITLAVPLICLLFRPREEPRRSSGIGRILLYYLGFLVITLPWFIFMSRIKGNPFWNENYLNIAFKMHEHARGWNVFPSSDQYRGLLGLILSDTVLFFRSWMRTAYDLPWLVVGLIPRVGFMASAGFFFWLAKFDRRKGILILAGVLYGLAVSLVWVENRFLLPLMPLVGAFIVSSVFALPRSMAPSGFSSRMSRSVQRVPLRAVAAVVLLALLLFISAGQIPGYFADQPLEYRAAADWLAQRVGGEASVMASKPHIAFFSKSRGISFRSHRLQDAGIEDIPEILAKANPTYFVYDERYAAVEFPQFRTLLDPHRNPYPDLLNPVFRTDSPRRLVIYKYEG